VIRRFLAPGAAVAALGLAPIPLAAQDTTRAVLRLYYDQPHLRPALVVLPAPGLDSARTIIERDLDYSNRFELIRIPAVMAPPGPDGINWAPYRAMNAALAVHLEPVPGGLTLRVYDVPTGLVGQELTAAVDTEGVGEGRMGLHRLADEVVRAITGSPGIAASRIVFVMDNRIWRVDSDGYGLVPLTPAGRIAYSPSWSADGQRIIYTEHADNAWRLVVHSLPTGSRTVVPGTAASENHTPAFSPDGRHAAFARVVDGRYAIHQTDVRDLCCTQRLTVGRFADNLSPTYSPDGRRIAFVTSRAGTPQIYVMAVDGTSQELMVPYEYGVSGASYAPDWSPDGQQLAFHRSTDGGFQVWVYDLSRERARQVTSEGRNEDPSWGPDGRHLVFVSTRTGRGQLHVIDLETGRVRVIPTPGAAKLPSWSRRLGGAP
jgi:TolB protein